MSENPTSLIASRFRGYLPVIVDVETGGFNAKTDALLEISAVCTEVDNDGNLVSGNTMSYHIKPFKGAQIEQSAIDFIGIDPYHPLRIDHTEEKALNEIFSMIRTEVRRHGCTKAILVGHNANFDLGFVNACAERIKAKRNPFHPFSCFDTATLSGLAYGQTVLARACETAEIDFNPDNAHSARYDAAKTAELFYTIVNRWKKLGGWPLKR